jgi:uncharacterized damage-inducible protein DinB
MKAGLLVGVVVISSMAFGQGKGPAADALRQMLDGREKTIVAALEQMPADKYGYKPTAEQMTFGHLAVHIAEVNYFLCGNTGAVPQPKLEELKGTEGKEKLVAAAKASFEFCHKALASADDSKMGESITWFDGKPRTRAWAFLGLAASWADHYGAAAMYLRQNDLLPPTAERKKP